MHHNRLLCLITGLLLSTGLCLAATNSVYISYYRGPTNVLASGLYSFTDLTNPAGSATRIGTQPFNNNWQKMAYDGSRYYTFVVNPLIRQGCGMYDAVSLTLLSTNSELGINYTYTNWHGLAANNLVFYGLYSGTNMTGPGLYRFTDPTDPEGTAERMFPTQTFLSNTWSDVAFDGTTWLFVRTASGGTAGVYQYNPQTDGFTLVSSSETYSVWNSLGMYTPPEPAPPANPLLHKKLFVILFGGQSNALGWGYHQYLYDTADPLALPQTDVDMYIGKGLTDLMNVVTNLQSGAGNPSVKAGTPQQYPDLTGTDAIDHFGPELSMGRTIRDLIHIPDSKVAVIKYAASGTSLYEDWKPDGTTNSAADGVQYVSFQTTVRNGLNALQLQYPDYEIQILGMGWVQGESDAQEGQASAYFANLTNFVSDVRKTFSSNMVFALSKLSPNQATTANFLEVRAAQQAAADSDPLIVATETTGTNYPVATGFAEGNLHYLSSALLQIGQDLGNAIMTTSGLDSDGDGLPDEWENGFAPGTAGLGNTPDADYDHDGVSDFMEYRMGTSPVDPNDRLSMTRSGLQIHWPAKKDIRYQMLISSNLAAWSEFGDPVLLRDSNNTVTVDFSQHMTTNRTGFLKLLVL